MDLPFFKLQIDEGSEFQVAMVPVSPYGEKYNFITINKPMKITDERWNEAQKAERACHDRFLEKDGEEYVRNHYQETYAKYFKYLDIKHKQGGKTIVEIGCADFPALAWCENMNGILIEPLPSKILRETVKNRIDLELISKKVEDIEKMPISDEVWLLNVLQHVQDPEVFIEKCKENTKVIRFFEPIDWPIEIYHPHTFTEQDFRNWFGSCVNRYGGTDREFHTAHCAYGIWKK